MVFDLDRSLYSRPYPHDSGKQNGICLTGRQMPLKIKDRRLSSSEFRGCAAHGGGTETLVEFVNATGCIDQFLLTGEKRVAGSADTNAQLFAGGTCQINRATSAGNRGVNVMGMDIVFHGDGFPSDVKG